MQPERVGADQKRPRVGAVHCSQRVVERKEARRLLLRQGKNARKLSERSKTIAREAAESGGSKKAAAGGKAGGKAPAKAPAKAAAKK